MTVEYEEKIKRSYNGSVIDIEASGLGVDSYPIEVAVVIGDITSYQALIKPEPQWTDWDEQAYRIHGISREELETYGLPIEQVCQQLNDVCRGTTIYSDCWVHDNRWLNKLFSTAQVAKGFNCSPIESVVHESVMEDWGTLKKHYADYMQISEHRALNDSLIIAHILENLYYDIASPTYIGTKSLESELQMLSVNSEANDDVGKILPFERVKNAR